MVSGGQRGPNAELSLQGAPPIHSHGELGSMNSIPGLLHKAFSAATSQYKNNAREKFDWLTFTLFDRWTDSLITAAALARIRSGGSIMRQADEWWTLAVVLRSTTCAWFFSRWSWCKISVVWDKWTESNRGLDCRSLNWRVLSVFYNAVA